MKTNNPYLFLLRKTWDYAEDKRRNFLTAIALLAFGKIIWMFKPYVLGQIFNFLQQGGADTFQKVIVALCIYAGIDVFSWIFWKPGRQIERLVAFHVRKNYFDRHYKYIKELPLKWHQDHHSGDTINRIKTAGDSLCSFSEMQFMYIIYILSFIGPLVAISIIAPGVALAAMIGAIVTLYVLWCFDQRLIPMFEAENERLNKFSAVFFDYVSNIRSIITLRLGERTRHELIRVFDTIFPIFNRQIRIHETKYMVMTIGNTIMMAFILGFFIYGHLKAGTLAIGTTIMLFQYMSMLNNTFIGFANDYQQIVRWRTNLRSAQDIETAHGASWRQHSEEEPPLWTSASIKNLNFNYKETSTLSNIEFDFYKGEKIAFVGESGAGKSTLMALIRGLYDVHDLELSLDGTHYDSLSPLFRMTTLIPQEPEIFENTIRYNVTMGVDCAEDDILQSVRLANFDSVVKTLPNGLETDVREKGVTLSGGEKQRLALARGILAAYGSQIILMDEPTSSVDTQNETAIYENLFQHFAGKTIMSSVHRLHLLPRFDKIIVMDRGRIIQIGSWDQLVRKEGLFKSLWEKYAHAHK